MFHSLLVAGEQSCKMQDSGNGLKFFFSSFFFQEKGTKNLHLRPRLRFFREVILEEGGYRRPIEVFVGAYRGGVACAGHPQEAFGAAGGLVQLSHHSGGDKVVLYAVDK